MFGTDLRLSNVGAAATDKLFRVEVVGRVEVGVATGFATEVGFVAFEAKVVRISAASAKME